MKRSTIGAVAACALALGCGHDHGKTDRGEVATGTAAELLKDQDDAADAIIAEARAYLDAREKTGKPAPRGAIAAHDFALEAIMDAAAAFRVAARAERLAEDVDADPGRAARVKNAAALLRRAAQVTANQAKETLRSAAGDEAALKSDALFMRSLLRALKVDLVALERTAGE